MRKKIAGISLPLFVILPWVGFITNLFDLRSKRGAFIYIAFAMVFGYAISFSDQSADSVRYAQSFSSFDNSLDYSTILMMYKSGELRDIYLLILFYFTSLFTNNPKVMFAFAGMVYGIFSFLSFKILLKELNHKYDLYVFILGLVFYALVSLSNINGFRFWTGALILFYSTYNSIILNKNIWLIGVLITPLFHYGFILMMPIIIMYRFIEYLFYNKNRVWVYLFYLFILSFAVSWVLETNAISLSFISGNDMLSGEIGSRLNYLNSEEISGLVKHRSESSMFLGVQRYFNYAIKIYVFIVILFLWQLLKKYNGNKIEYNRLFALVLFFYSVSFIATSFPSGGRFLSIGHMFLFILLGKFYAINKSRSIKRIIVFSLPVFSFGIIFYNIVLPLMLLTPTFWYGNIIWIIIEGIGFRLY